MNIQRTLLACAVLVGISSLLRADESSDTAAIRRQAVNWFKATNKGGPEGRMVAPVTKDIEAALDDGRHVGLVMGPEVSKDGKPHYGLSWAGVFFKFDLTPEQARRFRVKPDVVTTQQGAKRTDVRAAEPVGQLERVQLSQSGFLAGNREINGSVRFQLYREPEQTLLLRISYKLRGSTVQVTKPQYKLPDDGVIKFSIDPINSKDSDEVYDGPLPIFFDLCVEKGSDSDRRKVVLSNTVGMLANINGGGTTTTNSPAPVNLIGSKWNFPGTKSTITFLAGGKFLWNDEESAGFWTQQKKSVTINTNNFTLFELELISDEEMTGTWKRLQGDDIGKKNPSSLKRVSNRR